jgi:hypothetical protein
MKYLRHMIIAYGSRLIKMERQPARLRTLRKVGGSATLSIHRPTHRKELDEGATLWSILLSC